MRTPKIILLVAAAVILSGAGLSIMQSNAMSTHNNVFSMPYAVSNVTHNPQGVGSLYSYIIGNTSETDGFPAYEGPGSSQNQSMPQYIIIAINPVGNTTTTIMIGNTTEYTGSANSLNGPFLRSIFADACSYVMKLLLIMDERFNQLEIDLIGIRYRLVQVF